MELSSIPKREWSPRGIQNWHVKRIAASRRTTAQKLGADLIFQSLYLPPQGGLRDLKLRSNGKLDLLCTSSYIVDPVWLTNKLVENAISNGVELFLGSKVENITKSPNIF